MGCMCDLCEESRIIPQVLSWPKPSKILTMVFECGKCGARSELTPKVTSTKITKRSWTKDEKVDMIFTCNRCLRKSSALLATR